ncbi:MAG: hypothetical protein ACE5IC_01020 [Candidatus Brocadiales bacterium]
MRQSLFTAAILSCLLICLPSCDWYYSSEEEPVAEWEETETFREAQAPERATDEELKQAMKASAKYMKNLETAMDVGNWTAARVSAKKLEDLIGQRCVNLYIKTYGFAPEEFVNISQDFYTQVLKLLMAERYNKYDLARTHFDNMKADCEDCHHKFRKEKG